MDTYSTSNQQLAFALLVSGCTLAPHAAYGPAVNTYSIGFLRQKRFAELFFKLFGQRRPTLKEAAEALIKRKIPGQVTWVFIRNKTWEDAMAAWDEMHKEFVRAKNAEQEPIIPAVSTADTMRVMFVAANMTKNFKELVFDNRMSQMGSTIDTSTRDEPIPDAPGINKKVTTGSGKFWSLFGKQVPEHLHV